ncbi:MAG: signal recognition particle-docking protein FtsY [Nanoarchaeota archaeon]|nr:signal recognition particle-docking protein FtsY [Nanoarchaeota archaeon]
MFGSLKEKLGKAISIFSKKVEEEAELVDEPVKEKPKKEVKKDKPKQEQVIPKKTEEKKEKPVKKKEPKEKVVEKIKEIPKEVKPEIKEEPEKKEKKIFGIFKKKKKQEEIQEEKPEETVSTTTEKVEEEVHEKKGLFSKGVIRVKISDSKFEELFWDIELALLENNVAVEVIEKIKGDLKQEIIDQKFNAFSLQKKIQEIFNKSISEILSLESPDLFEEIKKKKPYVIAFIGVNGSGKTTSLAKVANLLNEKGYTSVIAACDNFRAAALQQIEEHANNLNIKLIKHDYGSDAAAVAFDAIKHAEAKKIEVVLIDTAGRSHSNINLMDELKKVIRVSKPDMKIFVGDSLTGNDVVEQAKSFNEAVGIDTLILSKMDIDEKGGASISVSYVTKKPIIFIGSGQEYSDIEIFDKDKILKVLNL